VAFRAMQQNRHYRVTSDGAPSATEFRMYRLSTPQGLDPLFPGRYRNRIEQWRVPFQTTRIFQMDYRNLEMLQTLGVRYAISYRGAPNEPVLASSPDFHLVGPDDSFYRIYEFQHARPSYQWDAAGEAVPTGWSPERRVFRVRSAEGGRFGLVEEFLPGWSATVDGKPAAISEWRDVFQAVAVPPGDHTVVFEYRSRWLPAGAAISLATFAALLWVALLASRKDTVTATECSVEAKTENQPHKEPDPRQYRQAGHQ
jgi:hypothetical protein